MKRYVFIAGLLLALLAPPARSADIAYDLEHGKAVEVGSSDTATISRDVEIRGGPSGGGNNLTITGGTVKTVNGSSITMNNSGTGIKVIDENGTLNLTGNYIQNSGTTEVNNKAKLIAAGAFVQNDSTTVVAEGDDDITSLISAYSMDVGSLTLNGTNFSVSKSDNSDPNKATAVVSSGRINMTRGTIVRLNENGTAPGKAIVQGASIVANDANFHMGENSQVRASGSGNAGIITLTNGSSIFVYNNNTDRFGNNYGTVTGGTLTPFVGPQSAYFQIGYDPNQAQYVQKQGATSHALKDYEYSGQNTGGRFLLSKGSQIHTSNVMRSSVGDVTIGHQVVNGGGRVELSGDLYLYGTGREANNERNIGNINILGNLKAQDGTSLPSQINRYRDSSGNAITYTGTAETSGRTAIRGAMSSSARVLLDQSFIQSMAAQKRQVENANGGYGTAQGEAAYMDATLGNAAILINYSGSGENYTDTPVGAPHTNRDETAKPWISVSSAYGSTGGAVGTSWGGLTMNATTTAKALDDRMNINNINTDQGSSNSFGNTTNRPYDSVVGGHTQSLNPYNGENSNGFGHYTLDVAYQDDPEKVPDSILKDYQSNRTQPNRQLTNGQTTVNASSTDGFNYTAEATQISSPVPDDPTQTSQYSTGTPAFNGTGSGYHIKELDKTAPNTEIYIDYSDWFENSAGGELSGEKLVVSTTGSGLSLQTAVIGYANINGNYVQITNPRLVGSSIALRETGPNHNSYTKTYHTIMGKYKVTTGNNLKSTDDSHTFKDKAWHYSTIYNNYKSHDSTYPHTHNPGASETIDTLYFDYHWDNWRNELGTTITYTWYDENGDPQTGTLDLTAGQNSTINDFVDFYHVIDPELKYADGSYVYSQEIRDFLKVNCYGDMNDLYAYQLEDEVDFSQAMDQAMNWEHFKKNVDYHFPLRTLSPGFLQAFFESLAYNSKLPEWQNRPTGQAQSYYLNEAYRDHRLGPKENDRAGQFNNGFFSAMAQTGLVNDGYGMDYISVGTDGRSHQFYVTRGLTEFYMGSTLLKVIQVNQDTARMNMGALGSRFDWIHRQFMRPILPPSGLPRTPDEQDPDMPKLLMSQKEKDRASQEAKAIETQAALASPIIHNYSSKVFNRIWLNALGTSERAGFFGEKDVSGREIAGYRYDTGGFILGYDHEHGDATYGGAFSFQHGSYRDLIMDYNNSKLQNYAISFYGTHSSFDEWYLNWIVGYSYANNKLNFGSGGADYKQDFETDTVYAQAMWGSDCWLIDHPTRSLRLTPSFGVGYIRTSSADHTANNTTIKADTHRFDIHRLGTGYLPASLELVFETDTYRGGNFSFSLIGGYQYNFSKKHASGSLTLLGMNGHAATYKTWGRQRRNRHTWNAGARVNYTARRWEVGLSYDFFKRNDSHAHLFNGNFGVFF